MSVVVLGADRLGSPASAIEPVAALKVGASDNRCSLEMRDVETKALQVKVVCMSTVGEQDEQNVVADGRARAA